MKWEKENGEIREREARLGETLEVMVKILREIESIWGHEAEAQHCLNIMYVLFNILFTTMYLYFFLL